MSNSLQRRCKLAEGWMSKPIWKQVCLHLWFITSKNFIWKNLYIVHFDKPWGFDFLFSYTFIVLLLAKVYVLLAYLCWLFFIHAKFGRLRGLIDVSKVWNLSICFWISYCYIKQQCIALLINAASNFELSISYPYFRLTLDLFGTETYWRNLLNARLNIPLP